MVLPVPQHNPGRTPGIPNRSSVELRARLCAATELAAPQYIQRVFGDHGYDPLVSLAVTSVTTTDLGLRSLCDKEIAQYFYSKRKSVEIAGPDGGEIEVKVDLVNTILGTLGTRVGNGKVTDVETKAPGSGSPGDPQP